MKPALPVLPIAAPWAAWFQLSLKFGEMLWASSQVIGHRSELMRKAGATPSPADLKEMHKMVAEKVEAFSKSSQRMTEGLAAMGPAVWLAPWGSARATQSMAKRLTTLSSHALAPVHAAATSNARRLNAKQRRVR
jgi:hypothetical protein